MLDENLRAIAPAVPPALLSLDRVFPIGAVLPADLTSFFGFECRLADARPVGDFLLMIDTRSRASLARVESWPRLTEFARQWCAEGSPLYATVDNVWLEFDVKEGVPVPSFFFRPLAPGGRRATLAQLLEVFGSVLGTPVTQTAANAMEACLHVLPVHAQVFSAGVMLGRTPSPVRLCFSHLQLDELSAVLTFAGCDGSLDLLMEFAGHADHVQIDLDFFDGVRPRIGVECRIRRGTRASRAPRWARLLDMLTSQGLCLPAKRDGLLAFPGVTHAASAGDAWPASLRFHADWTGGGSETVLVRDLHHVKLSLGGGAPEAKAYLSVATPPAPWDAIGARCQRYSDG